MFRPKLIDSLSGYTGKVFSADLVAGLTVGIVALPLAMAFAIASGVEPAAGLVTAVVAGFLISALGGSRVQIGGPTGAFVVIVYGILADHGPTELAVCTIMAGVILVIMGLARMGTMIKFIPYPVTMGFTSGIAVLIFGTQIKDFLGLDVASVPAGFVEKLPVLARHLSGWDPATTTVALGSLAIILAWPARWARRVPGTVVALLAATVAVALFRIPTETIGTRFGGIPHGLPAPRIPDFTFGGLRDLVQPATTIALLAAIESLLSAVVADGMIDDRHEPNQELVAQGIANIVTPLFGGIAATGAIARTATNVRSGGRTPVAGLTHSIVLLLVLLVAAPLAKSIPLATLSAILVIVAANMGEWHQFRRLRKWPRSDAAVFLTAFLLTVVIDLTVAVEVGMILAAVLFIRRVAAVTQITSVDSASDVKGSHDSIAGKDVPDEVLVFRIFGSFSFGVADRLETALKRARREPRIVVLRMREALFMDATGLNALEDLHEKLRNRRQHLLLVGPHAQPLMVMERAGLIEAVGRDNLCADIDHALDRAKVILSEGEPGRS